MLTAHHPVTCAIIHHNDTIFIARRQEGKSRAGLWEFPGGKVEPSETEIEALERELWEELHMKVEVGERLGAFDYDYGDIHICLSGYRCTLVEWDGFLTDHDRAEWVTVEELRNYALAPADVPFLALI